MSMIGPSVITNPSGARRRVKVLTLDARVLVRLLASMSRRDCVFRCEGLPEDVQVVGMVAQSLFTRPRDHEVKILIQSESFPEADQSQESPELDLMVTQHFLRMEDTIGTPREAPRRGIRLRDEPPVFTRDRVMDALARTAERVRGDGLTPVADEQRTGGLDSADTSGQ